MIDLYRDRQPITNRVPLDCFEIFRLFQQCWFSITTAHRRLTIFSPKYIIPVIYINNFVMLRCTCFLEIADHIVLQ